ncbi:retrovirus-related pol polyprotein from transposon TNT 1-94 [Tanacetum coccineum]
MENGLAIHMLTEKKYPLSQELLSKMLSKKLEVDHESSQAFELLRTITSLGRIVRNKSSQELILPRTDQGVGSTDDTHKQALGYQNLFYLKKAQRIKANIYDGSVISSPHVVIHVIDDEETLILEEVPMDLSKVSLVNTSLKKLKYHLGKFDTVVKERITPDAINGKKYILVIVDDYSRFTWVKFLRSKDEAPDAIIKCIKNIQVRLNATVCNVRIDNRTEFSIRSFENFMKMSASRIKHLLLTLLNRTALSKDETGLSWNLLAQW